MLFFGVTSQAVNAAIRQVNSDKIGFCISENQVGTKTKGYSGLSISDFENTDLFTFRDHSNTSNEYLENQMGLSGVHLDVFKTTPGKTIDFYIQETIRLVKYVKKLNPLIQIEIGTEEAVFKYQEWSFDLFAHKVADAVGNNVDYLVLQGGEYVDCLNNTSNINDIEFFKRQIKACKDYGWKSKLHNCDFLSIWDLKRRQNFGIDCFNISPEVAYIQNKQFIAKHPDKKYEVLTRILAADLDIYRWFKKRNPTQDEAILGNLHYVHPYLLCDFNEERDEIQNYISTLLSELF